MTAHLVATAIILLARIKDLNASGSVIKILPQMSLDAHEISIKQILHDGMPQKSAEKMIHCGLS